jgi:lysophospholipase L1-like esterase
MLHTPPPLLSTRRQVLTAGLFAALGTVAAAELLSAPRASAIPPTASTAARVSVVGDSLTQGTLPFQADAFANVDWATSTIDAFISRGVRTKVKRDKHTGLTSVDAIREKSGDSDLWVVALGTNDAGLYKRDKIPEIIDSMMQRIGVGHYVMWVNIYLPAKQLRQDNWNNALTTVAQDYPNSMFVLDWATLAAENPKWLAGDSIHCSGKGYEHRATAIAMASRSLIPPTPPDPGPYRNGRLWAQIPSGPALATDG